MNAPRVDVLAVMDKSARMIERAAQLGGNPDLRNERMACSEDVRQARAAVADLIEASARVVGAFEAYGKANGLVAEARARQECEAAMVAQKAAVERIGGAA